MRKRFVTIRMARAALWAAALAALVGGRVEAQGPLEGAVGEAREAWLAHDVERLVARSDTLRLQLPGIEVSAPAVRPRQGARLLARYLDPAEELSFSQRELRRLAPDHAYAEMVRVYVVRGTAEERVETVYLGFRVVGGEWRLREVRVTP